MFSLIEVSYIVKKFLPELGLDYAVNLPLDNTLASDLIPYRQLEEVGNYNRIRYRTLYRRG